MKTTRKPSTFWTTPEAAAREIYDTISSRDLGPTHAANLSDMLGERVFPHLEPEEVLDLATRLASLPTFVEVSAAMTILLRVAPLNLLCQVWRDATADAPLLCVPPSEKAEAARARLASAAAERQQALVEDQDDAITVEALREELAEDADWRAENAAQAIQEAEEQDAPVRASNASQALAEAEAEDAVSGATGEAFEKIRPRFRRDA